MKLRSSTMAATFAVVALAASASAATITFNTKNKSSAYCRMFNSYINTIPRATDLSSEIITFSFEKLIYCFFKW